MTWVIDSGMYYAAAGKCHQLARDLCLASAPLHSTLVHECVGMAGDHQDSQAWATAYGKHAVDIVTLAATLANALQRFGDVLAANGINAALAAIAAMAVPWPVRPTVQAPAARGVQSLQCRAYMAGGFVNSRPIATSRGAK